jgi:DDE superfamily endonuclease/Helix-turn-helix of DDE superfamily endonuclease
MTHSERLLRRPAIFRRLTGISPEAFRALLPQVEAAFDQAQRRRRQRPGRKRKPGAGPKHALALADRLLLLLVYYRAYVSHAFLALLFSIDQGTVSRYIAALEPLLAGIFRIPEREAGVREDEVQELFFDATERPTRRPKRRQRRWYSGKKKRHTLKNQVVVVRKRKRPGRRRAGAPPQKRRLRIAAVSRTAPGSTHDKKVYDRSRTLVPPGVRATGDTGYQGTALETPAKKPRGGELTKRQKRGNARISRRRIAAEHGIGKMKIWRIAGERWRNPLRRHTLVVKNVAGLHNLMFA